MSSSGLQKPSSPLSTADRALRLGRPKTETGEILAAAKGVSIGIAFQRKPGVGLFGGEGVIRSTD